MQQKLGRFDRIDNRPTPIHWLWVVGERGAVSTGFFMETEYAACWGVFLHSPRKPGAEDEDWGYGPCSYLEIDCFSKCLSLPLPSVNELERQFMRVGSEPVHDWLAAVYHNVLAQLELAG